jgi:hypothetical protein
MSEIRQHMTDIRTSIETVWKLPNHFRDCTVTVSDLIAVSLTIIAVSFVGCRSKEWIEIGKRLLTLPKPKTLPVEQCDSEDGLYAGICGSKSLVSLRMCNWHIAQRTAAFPTKESNNCVKFTS